jgi:hypothetical protein
VTTVRAIFSREFLDKLSSSERDKFDDTRKSGISCRLELLDFELVFEYMESPPAIHVFVEAFKFVDKPSPVKSEMDEPTPIDRNPQILDLIKKASIYMGNSRINGHLQPEDESEAGDGSKGEDGYDSEESLESQSGLPMVTDNAQAESANTSQSQEVFATQAVPAQSSPVHRRGQATTPKKTMVPPARNALLGLLQAVSKPKDSERGKEIEVFSETTATEGSNVKSPDKISTARSALAPRLTNDGIDSEGTKGALAAEEQSGHQKSQGSQDASPDKASPSSSRVDSALQGERNGEQTHVSGSLIPVASTHESRQPSALPEFPDHSAEQLQDDLKSSERSSKRRKRHHIPMAQRSDASDPWEGMTKIRRKDVIIPTDQMKLLESPDCWIPAEPGKITPRCHVPPKLLQKWNETVSRKSRPIADNVSERSRSENGEPTLPPVPSSPFQAESDSGESQPVSSWSTSPVDRNPPRRLLPPDSSPLQRPRSPRRADTPSLNNDAITLEEPAQNSQYGHVREHPAKPKSSNESNDIADGRSITPVLNVDEAEDLGSDASDMEVSVPCALGAVTQEDIPSQVEGQEITSSGPSLPTEKVQVIETPDERLRPKKTDVGRLPSQGSVLQSSSDATKTSSQSRICNSYDSSGRAVVAEQDPVPETQSSMDKATQNSGFDGQYQIILSHPGTLAAAEESPPCSGFSLRFDISSQPVPSAMSGVWDVSSGPEHDLPASSLLLKPTQTRPQLQMDIDSSNAYDGSTQDSWRMEIDAIPGPSPKRRAAEADLNEQSSPKRPRPAPTSHSEISGNRPESFRSGSIYHRDIVALSNRAADKAHEVFDKFRLDYPTYTGDFGHFTKMCSKLQVLRNRGHLQKSFLWDDFVIQHLTEYVQYLQECAFDVKEPLQYETYFCEKYAKPAYKKRSLTLHAIEIAASQCTSRASVGPVAPSVVHAEAKTSFTESLVEKLAGLQAHSSPNVRSNGILKPSQEAPRDGDMTDDDTDDTDDNEGVGETHETASIELGDENDTGVNDRVEIDSAASADESDKDIEKSSEGERCVDTSGDAPESGLEMEEGKRRTLADLLLTPAPPSGPSWSDSPNTPFKIWARADQNLWIDRRRRSGAAMPTDEQGVIQPPIYPRVGWERGMRTLGWSWKQSRDYS